MMPPGPIMNPFPKLNPRRRMTSSSFLSAGRGPASFTIATNSVRCSPEGWGRVSGRRGVMILGVGVAVLVLRGVSVGSVSSNTSSGISSERCMFRNS